MSADAATPSNPARGGRSKRHPWRTLGALGVLSLAMLELGLRVAGPDIFGFLIDARRVHRYSPRSKVDLLPNAAAHLWLPGGGDDDPLYNFVITTDRDGQRTHDRLRDHRARPEADTRYIHAIGDSFTMGWGVDYTSSYPALLEALLTPSHRVLNQGVDGFGTLGATEKSMSLWDRYPASHAVYLFSSNDFQDDATALAVRERSAAAQAFWQAFDVLRRHSYLANLPHAVYWQRAFHGRQVANAPAVERLRLDASARGIIVTPELRALPPEEPTSSMQHISRYRQFVIDRGARLIVLTIAGSTESLRFNRYCKDQGMDVWMIDVPPEWRLTDDGHFNAMGNYAVARLVRDLVLQ